MNQHIKEHVIPIILALSSLVGAHFIEPEISKQELDFTVQIIGFVVGIVFWFGFRIRSVILILFIVCLGTVVHLYRDMILVRQATLTIVIAGTLLSIREFMSNVIFNSNQDNE